MAKAGETELSEQDQLVVEAWRRDDMDAMYNSLKASDTNMQAIVDYIGGVDVPNKHGNTLLCVASKDKTEEYKENDIVLAHIKTLLEIGANPLKVINFVAQYHSPASMSIFLAHVPQGLSKAELCSTLLMPAMRQCFENRSSVIKILLDNGANPNYQTDKGNTVLHYAAVKLATRFEGNTQDVIALLVSRGGRMDLPNEALKTPMHYIDQILENEKGRSPLSDVLYSHDYLQFHQLISYGLYINNPRLLNDAALFSVIFKNADPLKSLISSGRLVLDPESLQNRDTEISIIAKAISEVALSIPIDQFPHITFAPCDNPEAISRMAPIKAVIDEFNQMRMENAMEEIAITGSFESSGNDATDPFLHNIMAQFQGDITPNSKEVTQNLQQKRAAGLKEISITGSHNSEGYMASQNPPSPNSFRKEVQEDGIDEILAQFHGGIPTASSRLMDPPASPSADLLSSFNSLSSASASSSSSPSAAKPIASSAALEAATALAAQARASIVGALAAPGASAAAAGHLLASSRASKDGGRS